MLAIWSRARHIPGTCRCISCVPSGSSLTSHGAQYRPRGLRLRSTPTSALVYTTAFAAGLVIDGRAKAARNERWDQAFAQLKEALDRPPSVAISEHPAGPAASHVPSHRRLPIDHVLGESDWRAVQRIVGMELSDDDFLRSREAQLQAQVHTSDDDTTSGCDDLHFESTQPDAELLEWPANTGHELVPNNLPPQSLWAPATLRLAAMRRRYTWKKLALKELSTGLLIHRFIRRANLPRFFKTAEVEVAALLPQLRHVACFSVAEGQLAFDEISASIEKLQSTPVHSNVDDNVRAMLHVDQPAIPRYSQDADGDFYGICHQMNDGIEQIFRSLPRGNDRIEAFAIAKICHNLLVSTAAPDLRTFNLLLSGFKRWRCPQLIDNVIGAFYAHKIRPNEVTCSEILRHYTLESRPDDFSRFVARMRGVGDALMLANPSVTVNEASQGRLVRIDEHKIFQKVHPTPMVFDALIHGVLRFAGFDRALDIYYEMKEDGWGLDTHALTRLLRDCVRRADWEGGLYLWEEINTIKARTKARDMAKAYYHMLSLCSITGNTTAFNQVLNEVARRGLDRKAIIDAAIETTRWARRRGINFAPAFAADNVLIAVSDYVNDTKPHTVADLTMDDSDTPVHHDGGLNTSKSTEDTSTPQQQLISPGEAWASWVEHEFRGRSKDSET